MATITHADVLAGVQRASAAYTQALDDGRTDDVVATFCADGSVEIPGLGAHQGHDALRRAYAGIVPRRPQRHLVVNTLVIDWDDEQAQASSDVVVLLQGKDGWAVLTVGRYQDVLRREDDGAWRFHRRTAEFVQ